LTHLKEAFNAASSYFKLLHNDPACCAPNALVSSVIAPYFLVYINNTMMKLIGFAMALMKNNVQKVLKIP
jgi:hypothetical protein